MAVDYFTKNVARCQNCQSIEGWRQAEDGPVCGFCEVPLFGPKDDRYEGQWYDQEDCRDCNDGVVNGKICPECWGVGCSGYSW